MTSRTHRTGRVISAHDDTSIGKYGYHAQALGWPHNDLHLVYDEDVSVLVNIVLRQQKDDFIGVSSIDLDADLDPVHLFGVMSSMASRGIGNQAFFDVHYVHPDGPTLDDSVRMIGIHGIITREGDQCKYTATIRTVANQGPVDEPPAWVTAHDYVSGDYVVNGGQLYLCVASHTSGTDEDQPGVGAEWPDWWEIP